MPILLLSIFMCCLPSYAILPSRYYYIYVILNTVNSKTYILQLLRQPVLVILLVERSKKRTMTWCHVISVSQSLIISNIGRRIARRSVKKKYQLLLPQHIEIDRRDQEDLEGSRIGVPGSLKVLSENIFFWKYLLCCVCTAYVMSILLELRSCQS